MTLGIEIEANNLISFKAASFYFCPTFESKIDFIAYCCFVYLFRMRYTLPKLPNPNYFMTSKSLIDNGDFYWEDFIYLELVLRLKKYFLFICKFIKK